MNIQGSVHVSSSSGSSGWSPMDRRQAAPTPSTPLLPESSLVQRGVWDRVIKAVTKQI